MRPIRGNLRLVMAPLVASWGLFSAASALAQTEPQAPPSVLPASATSQCVEGPGAPPADPTKVKRVVSSSAKADETVAEQTSAPSNFIDAKDAKARTFLEVAAFSGFQVRMDDPQTLVLTGRAGPVLGGAAFVWPTRVIGFGVGYTYADLGRTESVATSPTVVAADYSGHALLAEARVAPFRFNSAVLFASIGGGLVWQHVSLVATFPPLDGQPGGSFRCDAGSNVEFGFRAGVGIKAQIAAALTFVGEASFQGYRFTSDVLSSCAPGAGTAQTLMARFGLAYDINVTRAVR